MSHTWLFIKIQQNLKFNVSVILVIFQLLNCHMWLVGAMMDSRENISITKKLLLGSSAVKIKPKGAHCSESHTNWA